jgi:hypothetical protein
MYMSKIYDIYNYKHNVTRKEIRKVSVRFSPSLFYCFPLVLTCLTDNLFDSFTHEIDEPPGVLFGVAGADPVHVRTVLYRFRRLRRLLLHAVVREYVNYGDEVDLFHWSRLAAGYGVNIQFRNYSS